MSHIDLLLHDKKLFTHLKPRGNMSLARDACLNPTGDGHADWLML